MTNAIGEGTVLPSGLKAPVDLVDLPLIVKIYD